jgi:hypothetical protein
MELFERLNSLEGLPRILDEIWHRCLNKQPEKNEEKEIGEALESIETGMVRLQKILNKR